MPNSEIVNKTPNHEIDLWLKMVDSMANVISASTTLIHLMNKELKGLQVSQEQKKELRTSSQENILMESFDRAHKPLNLQLQYPSYFSDKEKIGTFSRQNSNKHDFLDEEYNSTKHVISRRYRPQSKITTLYSRGTTKKDIINETFTEGLYRISNIASEKAIYPSYIERFEEIHRMDKPGSAKTTSLTYQCMRK